MKIARWTACWVSTFSLFLVSASLFASPAFAGTFDPQGRFTPDAKAVAFEDFDSPERFLPEDSDPDCTTSTGFKVVASESAMHGQNILRVKAPAQCPEWLLVGTAPASEGSYRATVWMRHGGLGARVVVVFPESAARGDVSARLAPTGRSTSDGWVEMASNEIPIDGTFAPSIYLRLANFADQDGVDVDAFELVAEGTYEALDRTCEGARDPVCGSESVCVAGRCRLGRLSVPPLPSETLRPKMIASMRGKLETFFGGRKTRLEDLPRAFAILDGLGDAKTAWEFWNGWGHAVRELHDWHTSASSPFLDIEHDRRLNACFIEGDADLSQQVWAKHPIYKDILVSHAGPDGADLRPGDRLVAIDGDHPIQWARQLVDLDWAHHPPCDNTTFADYAEGLGGRNGLITRYAKSITVIRCDAGVCGTETETIAVKDLLSVSGGQRVACDNRPTYHVEGPNPANHFIFGDIYQGRVLETAPEEAIYTMVWDTLSGNGEPNGYVNGTIRSAIEFWKTNARGVILDHRAGNGGTLDAPEWVTSLVRPLEIRAVVRMPMETAGFNGPNNAAEGIALFEASKADSPYTIGSANHDPTLPVALLTHRDGSASDYLPLGMKGAPNVRIFGPGPTAGAFSTYISFSYWGGIAFQFASGDTITSDGEAMIGKGVVPDVIVQQKQSDLMAGKDSIFEAALAWVRANSRTL